MAAFRMGDVSLPHKLCLTKRNMSPFAEAAKALLSSPLPPELVVDFKGANVLALSSLRNSTSESSVNLTGPTGEDCAIGGRMCPERSSACRTYSDGAKKSYARRKLESEDSSYDSDYECLESLSSLSAAPVACAPAASTAGSALTASSQHEEQHEDVSRTVSDTLAAEFNEYVCVSSPSFHRLSEAPETDSDDSDSGGSCVVDAYASDPSYSSRIEFALKLGYTQTQVRRALNKLGASPAQNELLAELIRLASLDGPATTSGADSSVAESPLNVIRSHRPLSGSNSDESWTSCSSHSSPLRHIVIDGSNVAISHGNKDKFSCRGIQLCVDWFRSRGHKDITVFVPMWRKEMSKIETPITNQEILFELERERMLVFTPSRQVAGRRLVCYDDRYILRLAAETDGVVVSNDNYRDLIAENPEYRRIVEERILMYSFVNDRFMPPEDPLGRNGPNLDQFLRKVRDSTCAPPCPYAKKCTYGNKCKYYHPERGNVPQKTITERLAEQAHKHLLEVKSRSGQQQQHAGGLKKCGDSIRDPGGKTLSLPLSKDLSKATRKTPLSRTKSIVPTHTFPPELVEERPVKDVDRTSIPASTTSSMPKSKSVENMARLTACCGHNAYPNMMRTPPPPPPAFCLPPPNMAVEMPWGVSGAPQYHTALTQRLSDPPCHPENAQDNPHRKVERQLTLNPIYDPRLTNVKLVTTSLAPPYPPPPLASHPHVTRNASAPVCPLSGTQQQHQQQQQHVANPIRHQRLNSTSDTQLNMYGSSSSFLSTSQHSLHADPFDADWTQLPPVPLQQQQQQHSWMARTSSLPVHQSLGSSVQGSSALCRQGSARHCEPDTCGEARFKLFFHLAAIFPEHQVRQVMALMPDETNAQKICAAILNFYPKDN